MLAVMLRADGWRVEFLGVDTPIDTAFAFADRIGATMLCISSARSESVDALRLALAPGDRRPTAVLVVGGAAVDSETAGELRAIYADGRLDLAVTRLRNLAVLTPG
jgi:methanogenic corrinoid protein MtbC1